MQQMLPPKSNPPRMVVIPKSDPPPNLELLMQPLEDDEPTVKMRVPPHLLWQSRGPNWGLLLALGFCLAFWGSVIYLFWRAHG